MYTREKFVLKRKGKLLYEMKRRGSGRCTITANKECAIKIEGNYQQIIAVNRLLSCQILDKINNFYRIVMPLSWQ